MAGELTKAQLSLLMSKLVKLLPTLKPRRLLVVMLLQLTALLPKQTLSQRTTIRVTKSTWPILPRRSSHSVPVSLRPASQMKAASRTRSGQMPRLLLRRKKRTSLLPQLARPSVSVSASRSRPSTLISASLRPLSSVVEDEVVSEAVEAAAMAHPVVEEARVVVGEAKAEEDVVALQEVVAVATQELLAEALRPSTLTTRVPSQAWVHEVSSQEPKSLQMII